MIPNLLPRSAYEPSGGAAQWRTILVMAALWGVPMTAVMLVVGGAEIGLVRVGLFGVIAGLGFGLLWTLWFGRSMGKLMHRLYAADPAIVPPPPEGRYGYRLPCSCIASSRMSVGGHLYVGPDELTFVPHYKNAKRHQTPVAFPVAASLRIETIDVELTGVARLLAKSPVRRVRIASEGREAVFVVPEPETVVFRLREPLQGVV